ncbi:MAG: H-X9-DG-CTERM domain-containing protein, partial [Planctomycetota bacterium]
NITWTEPRDVDLDSLEWSLQAKDSAAQRDPWRSRTIGSSYHSNGTHAVFGDGSTRYLSSAIDGKILEKMIRGETWNSESFE